MNRIAQVLSGLVLVTMLPQAAEAKLSKKEEARVSRAIPEEQDAVRYCLEARKKGGKKGAIVGAAGGLGTGLIAGGNLGESALAAGVGAVVGNALGRGTSTDRTCDEVLKANK